MLKTVTSWLHKPEHSASEIKAQKPALQAYLHHPGQPVWSERRYQPFADEGYVKNVIAHRAISMVASAAASVNFSLFESGSQGGRQLRLKEHPLLTLLRIPQAGSTGRAMVETLVSYRLISGNAYILAVGPDLETPKELHVLRPDRMSVLTGTNGYVSAYRHKVGERHTDYPVDMVSGFSRILHLKISIR